MTIRALTAFLASTGALWATAGESRAQSYVDADGSAYVGQYEDPALGYAPQYGPVQQARRERRCGVTLWTAGSVMRSLRQKSVAPRQPRTCQRKKSGETCRRFW